MMILKQTQSKGENKPPRDVCYLLDRAFFYSLVEVHVYYGGSYVIYRSCKMVSKFRGRLRAAKVTRLEHSRNPR